MALRAILISCGFLAGFILSFLAGPTEVCHSLVAAGILSKRSTFITATICILLGTELLGHSVAETLTTEIVDIQYMRLATGLGVISLLSSIISALIPVLVLRLLKIPVSPSHFIVPAIVGSTFIVQSPDEIMVASCLRILASWLLTPVLSGIISALLFAVIRKTVLRSRNLAKKFRNTLLILPIICAAAVSLASFTIVFQGSKMLYFHLIPVWGVVIISLGTGSVTYIIIAIAIVPWLRQRLFPHLDLRFFRKKSLGMAEQAKTQRTEGGMLVVEQIKKDEPSTSEQRPIPSVSTRVVSGTMVVPPELRFTVFLDDDDEDDKENSETVVIPFLDHEKCFEYFLVPGRLPSEVTSTDIIHSDLPRLITPRSTFTNRMPEPVRFHITDEIAEVPEVPESIDPTHPHRIGQNRTLKAWLQANASESEDLALRLSTANRQSQGGREGQRKKSSVALEGITPLDVTKPYAYSLILIACFSLLAKGGSEVSNAMGLALAIYHLYTMGEFSETEIIEPLWWVFLIGGCGVCVGLWVVGRKQERRSRETDAVSSPVASICVHFGSAFVVLIACELGMPVSLIHCELFSMAFVSLCRSRDQVEWETFTKMGVSWIPALVGCALLSAGFTAMMGAMFNIKPFDRSTNTTTPIFMKG